MIPFYFCLQSSCCFNAGITQPVAFPTTTTWVLLHGLIVGGLIGRGVTPMPPCESLWQPSVATPTLKPCCSPSAPRERERESSSAQCSDSMHVAGEKATMPPAMIAKLIQCRCLRWGRQNFQREIIGALVNWEYYGLHGNYGGMEIWWLRTHPKATHFWWVCTKCRVHIRAAISGYLILGKSSSKMIGSAPAEHSGSADKIRFNKRLSQKGGFRGRKMYLVALIYD